MKKMSIRKPTFLRAIARGVLFCFVLELVAPSLALANSSAQSPQKTKQTNPPKGKRTPPRPTPKPTKKAPVKKPPPKPTQKAPVKKAPAKKPPATRAPKKAAPAPRAELRIRTPKGGSVNLNGKNLSTITRTLTKGGYHYHQVEAFRRAYLSSGGNLKSYSQVSQLMSRSLGQQVSVGSSGMSIPPKLQKLMAQEAANKKAIEARKARAKASQSQAAAAKKAAAKKAATKVVDSKAPAKVTVRGGRLLLESPTGARVNLNAGTSTQLYHNLKAAGLAHAEAIDIAKARMRLAGKTFQSPADVKANAQVAAKHLQVARGQGKVQVPNGKKGSVDPKASSKNALELKKAKAAYQSKVQANQKWLKSQKSPTTPQEAHRLYNEFARRYKSLYDARIQLGKAGGGVLSNQQIKNLPEFRQLATEHNKVGNLKRTLVENHKATRTVTKRLNEIRHSSAKTSSVAELQRLKAQAQNLEAQRAKLEGRPANSRQITREIDNKIQRARQLSKNGGPGKKASTSAASKPKAPAAKAPKNPQLAKLGPEIQALEKAAGRARTPAELRTIRGQLVEKLRAQAKAEGRSGGAGAARSSRALHRVDQKIRTLEAQGNTRPNSPKGKKYSTQEVKSAVKSLDTEIQKAKQAKDVNRIRNLEAKKRSFEAMQKNLRNPRVQKARQEGRARQQAKKSQAPKSKAAQKAPAANNRAPKASQANRGKTQFSDRITQKAQSRERLAREIQRNSRGRYRSSQEVLEAARKNPNSKSLRQLKSLDAEVRNLQQQNRKVRTQRKLPQKIQTKNSEFQRAASEVASKYKGKYPRGAQDVIRAARSGAPGSELTRIRALDSQMQSMRNLNRNLKKSKVVREARASAKARTAPKTKSAAPKASTSRAAGTSPQGAEVSRWNTRFQQEASRIARSNPRLSAQQVQEIVRKGGPQARSMEFYKARAAYNQMLKAQSQNRAVRASGQNSTASRSTNPANRGRSSAQAPKPAGRAAANLPKGSVGQQVSQVNNSMQQEASRAWKKLGGKNGAFESPRQLIEAARDGSTHPELQKTRRLYERMKDLQAQKSVKGSRAQADVAQRNSARQASQNSSPPAKGAEISRMNDLRQREASRVWRQNRSKYQNPRQVLEAIESGSRAPELKQAQEYTSKMRELQAENRSIRQSGRSASTRAVAEAAPNPALEQAQTKVRHQVQEAVNTGEYTAKEVFERATGKNYRIQPEPIQEVRQAIEEVREVQGKNRGRSLFEPTQEVRAETRAPRTAETLAEARGEVLETRSVQDPVEARQNSWRRAMSELGWEGGETKGRWTWEQVRSEPGSGRSYFERATFQNFSGEPIQEGILEQKVQEGRLAEPRAPETRAIEAEGRLAETRAIEAEGRLAETRVAEAKPWEARIAEQASVRQAEVVEAPKTRWGQVLEGMGWSQAQGEALPAEEVRANERQILEEGRVPESRIERVTEEVRAPETRRGFTEVQDPWKLLDAERGVLSERMPSQEAPRGSRALAENFISDAETGRYRVVDGEILEQVRGPRGEIAEVKVENSEFLNRNRGSRVFEAVGPQGETLLEVKRGGPTEIVPEARVRANAELIEPVRDITSPESTRPRWWNEVKASHGAVPGMEAPVEAAEVKVNEASSKARWNWTSDGMWGDGEVRTRGESSWSKYREALSETAPKPSEHVRNFDPFENARNYTPEAKEPFAERFMKNHGEIPAEKAVRIGDQVLEPESRVQERIAEAKASRSPVELAEIRATEMAEGRIQEVRPMERAPIESYLERAPVDRTPGERAPIERAPVEPIERIRSQEVARNSFELPRNFEANRGVETGRLVEAEVPRASQARLAEPLAEIKSVEVAPKQPGIEIRMGEQVVERIPVSETLTEVKPTEVRAPETRLAESRVVEPVQARASSNPMARGVELVAAESLANRALASEGGKPSTVRSPTAPKASQLAPVAETLAPPEGRPEIRKVAEIESKITELRSEANRVANQAVEKGSAKNPVEAVQKAAKSSVQSGEIGRLGDIQTKVHDLKVEKAKILEAETVKAKRAVAESLKPGTPEAKLTEVKATEVKATEVKPGSSRSGSSARAVETAGSPRVVESGALEVARNPAAKPTVEATRGTSSRVTEIRAVETAPKSAQTGAPKALEATRVVEAAPSGSGHSIGLKGPLPGAAEVQFGKGIVDVSKMTPRQIVAESGGLVSMQGAKTIAEVTSQGKAVTPEVLRSAGLKAPDVKAFESASRAASQTRIVQAEARLNAQADAMVKSGRYSSRGQALQGAELRPLAEKIQTARGSSSSSTARATEIAKTGEAARAPSAQKLSFNASDPVGFHKAKVAEYATQIETVRAEAGKGLFGRIKRFTNAKKIKALEAQKSFHEAKATELSGAKPSALQSESAKLQQHPHQAKLVNSLKTELAKVDPNSRYGRALGERIQQLESTPGENFARSSMHLVAIAAGTNLFFNVWRQVKQDGEVDLGKAASFLATKEFWMSTGGMIGGVFVGQKIASTTFYELLATRVTGMTPLGGTFVKLFPAFALGALGATILSGGLKDADWGHIAAHTIGSTLGTAIAISMFATGPIGQLVGALVGGFVAEKLLEMFRHGPESEHSERTGGEVAGGADDGESEVEGRSDGSFSSQDVEEVFQGMKTAYDNYRQLEDQGEYVEAAAAFENYMGLKRQLDSMRQTAYAGRE